MGSLIQGDLKDYPIGGGNEGGLVYHILARGENRGLCVKKQLGRFYRLRTVLKSP